MPYTVRTYPVSMTLSMYYVKKKKLFPNIYVWYSNCQWCIWKVFQTPFKHQNNISKVHVYPELRMNSSLSPLCMYTRIQCQKKCAGGCPCIIILLAFFLDFFEVALHNFEVGYWWGECVSGIRCVIIAFSGNASHSAHMSNSVFSGKKATNFQHNLWEYLLFWL